MADTPPTQATTEQNAAGSPYCGNCGYSLIGATASPNCPECGKPLVEVLQRRGSTQMLGRRYQSETRAFGMPLVCVAFGPHGDETRGHAKGIIAIGDVATGWLAIGGMARGVIAFGGLALGLIAHGGLALGLLAFGGLGVGGLAIGGGAIGGLASGGSATGIVAEGGLAIGYIARGGTPIGTHTMNRTGGSQVARETFAALDRLLGLPPGPVPIALGRIVLLFTAITVLVAGVLACSLLVGIERKKPT